MKFQTLLESLMAVWPSLNRWWRNRQAGTPATSAEVREDAERRIDDNRSGIADSIDDKFGSPE